MVGTRAPKSIASVRSPESDSNAKNRHEKRLKLCMYCKKIISTNKNFLQPQKNLQSFIGTFFERFISWLHTGLETNNSSIFSDNV